jgi:hypothetical protein
VVGRELPNLRPNGEDHRGASGGDIKRMKGTRGGMQEMRCGSRGVSVS